MQGGLDEFVMERESPIRSGLTGQEHRNGFGNHSQVRGRVATGAGAASGKVHLEERVPLSEESHVRDALDFAVSSDVAQEESDGLLRCLDRICSSTSFQGSNRCQQFLRFVVQQTLSGKACELKERTIAMEVFGRGLDFEPGEEALVRVRARELRKRLQNYYNESPGEEFHIEIPLGSYAPKIKRTQPAGVNPLAKPEPEEDQSVSTAAELASEELPQRKLWTRRRVIASAAAAVVGLGVAISPLRKHLLADADGLQEIWSPIFRTHIPLVIFVPVLTDRDTREVSDRVGIGPLEALRRTADFLDSHQYRYHLRLGSDLNYSLLREQPSLLLGGFSSIWTLRMMQGLRFVMHWNDDYAKRTILDSSSGETWSSINPTRQGYADKDFGVLTRIFDRETGQIVMIAAGLTTFGTEGAAAVLTDVELARQLAAAASSDWQTKNFQAVVRVEVVGVTPSVPQIIATHFW